MLDVQNILTAIYDSTAVSLAPIIKSFYNTTILLLAILLFRMGRVPHSGPCPPKQNCSDNWSVSQQLPFPLMWKLLHPSLRHKLTNKGRDSTRLHRLISYASSTQYLFLWCTL